MRTLIGLLFAVFAAYQSPAPGEADVILDQLSKIRLDKKQIYNIRDITIRRDALSISFNRGTIAFLEPVNGKVTGAVYIGSGEIVAIPSDPIEKQQVFKFTGAPLLNERFAAAFLRFTDNTYEEILREYNDRAHEDVTDFETAQFLPWDATLSDRSGLLSYRILAELLGKTDRPLFFAQLNGERTGWLDVIYDPRLVEEVAIVRSPGETGIADMWASFNRRTESRDREAVANESKAAFDVLSYRIDSTVTPEAQLDVKASLRLKNLAEGERVLSFDLSRRLRVTSVTMDPGEALRFYQHQNMTPEEIRQYGSNSIAIVLPQPLRSGQEITLQFEYRGDVLGTRDAGVFSVGERGSWYPNIGLQDRAAFDLTFHYPPAYTLVATGNSVKEWESDGLRHSNWVSEGEFPIAGFNLGSLTVVADETAPPIYVSSGPARTGTTGTAPTAATGTTATAAPAEAAEDVLKDTRSALAYFSELLGAFPYKRLTVSLTPLNVLVNWPSLLYFAPIAVADTATRDFVRAHELAHQWIGSRIGWRSYHDQWISEAFAGYSAAMFIEHKYPDTPQFRTLLNDAKVKLLDRDAAGNTKESGGPLWLGHRLTTAANPDGSARIIYNKGTWVVHMLRTLMGDEAFKKMVREFFETHQDSLVTTFDLKKAAEKHMTSAMDLRTNGKLDWFFDQWVLGTGIPKYALDYKVDASGSDFVIEGTITQSGVPEDFVMPVPVYADDVLLGRVVVDTENGNFRFTVKQKPTAVTVDPNATILTQ